jgi:tetratricopeptide (TPR) repeat protein
VVASIAHVRSLKRALCGMRISGMIARCALALSLLALAAMPVRASDFWDEVRNPGLGAHRMHLRRGREALAGNRPEAALDEADAAIARCAECAAGPALRGRALSALGRHAQAVAAFQQALRLDAAALDAITADGLALAFSACSVARPELAAGALERVLAQSRDSGARNEAIAMLADALQAEGPAELKRAIMTYREAMADDAARKRVLLGLALALDRDGAHDEALALARRAGPESDPNTTAAWLAETERAARLALWLTAIGDSTAADQAWQRASEGGGPWAGHASEARKRNAHGTVRR